jgi:hypothetical protein
MKGRKRCVGVCKGGSEEDVGRASPVKDKMGRKTGD